MHTPSRKPSAAGYTPDYPTLRPFLASGDIVLYGGDTPQCVRLKKLMRSRWSHVGLVLRPDPEGEPLLWEATGTPGMPDLVDGTNEGGVQLVRLEEWIARYGGDIAVRRLMVDRSLEMEQAFRAFFTKVHGRPYERTHTQAIRAPFAGFLLRNRREDLSTLFCSELVAAAYQRVGLLPRDPPSNTYTPRHFGAEGEMKLLGAARLDDEVVIHL